MVVERSGGEVALTPSWARVAAGFVKLGIGHVLSCDGHLPSLLCRLISPPGWRQILSRHELPRRRPAGSMGRPNFRRIAMSRLIRVGSLVLGLLAASAHAADATCDAQATDKKLAGAAKTSFMKKCATDTCDAQAAEKKLAGAAKTSFVKKCVADAQPAGKSAKDTCEGQAAEKKLAGAAKASFVKKCIADAG